MSLTPEPSKPGNHTDLDGFSHPPIGTLREQLLRAFEANRFPRQRSQRKRLLNPEKVFRNRQGGRT